jgi:PEP-CTERM motif
MSEMSSRIIVVPALVTLAFCLSLFSPAEALVISPSPLDCSINNGACSPLSGVGSLSFSTSGNNLVVTYAAPAGFKIVGGDQFALNLTGVSGNVGITGTGITGTVQIPIQGNNVAGCNPCFNFDTQAAQGGNVIDTNLPTGTVYTFTLSASTPLTLNSVVAGGPLNLDAELHLNTGGPNGQSVFAAETGRVVPEPATLTYLGTGLVAVGFAIRRRLRRG